MRRSFDRIGLLGVFSSMLASLGGIFTPIEFDTAPDPNPKKRRKDARFSPHARPLRMDGYYVDNHGSLRRRTPKRDKSMSGRQWRKLRREVRDERQKAVARIGGAQ